MLGFCPWTGCLALGVSFLACEMRREVNNSVNI